MAVLTFALFIGLNELKAWAIILISTKLKLPNLFKKKHICQNKKKMTYKLFKIPSCALFIYICNWINNYPQCGRHRIMNEHKCVGLLTDVALGQMIWNTPNTMHKIYGHARWQFRIYFVNQFLIQLIRWKGRMHDHKR